MVHIEPGVAFLNGTYGDSEFKKKKLLEMGEKMSNSSCNELRPKFTSYPNTHKTFGIKYIRLHLSKKLTKLNFLHTK